jgi:ParB family transcriptional regulator, chromosome partitioning protein
MPDPVQPIPTAAIAEDALNRDRTAADPQALEELRNSILATGVRMPIEVFPLADPDGPRRYGLISGFRRLAAVRALAAIGLAGHDTIPAFVRAPATLVAAMTAMVEENAIRADVSPWEQARLAVTAVDRGLFDTVDAAIATLYANLGRDKRKRLRAIAHLAVEVEGLAAPESLSLRRLLELAAAVARGYGPLIQHALTESRARTPDEQWRLLQPILAECDDPAIPDPDPARGERDRPRRTYADGRLYFRVRREWTPDGWILRFTGRDARGELLDRVFAEIERLLGPT